VLAAVEPTARDRVVMQDTLRKYLRALNSCDGAGARAVLAGDFEIPFSWTRQLSGRLLPTVENCPPGRAPFEITGILRFFAAATDDVVLADGTYRTVGFPKREEVGRMHVLFVRREGDWRVFRLRFGAVAFEPPIVGVEPALHHDSPGPDGWVTLFDGKSAAAFQDLAGGPLPSTWRVEDGALRTVPGRGGRALRTRDTYRSFELQWEWKAAAKSNSGVKYRLFYMDTNTPAGGADGVGFEYQLADDTGDPGAIEEPTERSGALYLQVAPKGAVLKPLGEWNRSALIVRGSRSEHWLNDVKVMEYEAESTAPESPILLQHHVTDFWFRNIRIRRLD